MGIVINDGPVFPIGEFGVRHNALLPRPGGDPGENQPGYPALSVRVMTPAPEVLSRIYALMRVGSGIGTES
jgi:hypothetical protein